MSENCSLFLNTNAQSNNLNSKSPINDKSQGTSNTNVVNVNLSSSNSNNVNSINMIYQNNSYKPKGRWNNLYLHSKLLKVKEDEYRKKQMAQREKDLMTECTFSPKLIPNKYQNSNYLMVSQEQQNDKNNLTTSNYNQGGLNQTQNINDVQIRQINFVQRKAIKLEKLKQNRANKELEECSFMPETVI